MAISINFLMTCADKGIRPHLRVRPLGRYAGRTAFLSHSIFDEKLARGVINVLTEIGWTVSLHSDERYALGEMNGEVMEERKSMIRAADYFLYLATPNTLISRWGLWEMGYANGIKSPDRILVIPTTDGVVTHGQEYLRLYRYIDKSKTGVLTAFSMLPGSDSVPIRLL